jgi:sialate O-acetylesterase
MNLTPFTFFQSLTLLGFVLPTGLLQAEIGLSAAFGDHMVLQRGLSLPVWGWADPGEEITITFAGQQKKTKAKKSGDWQVRLDALESSAEGREFKVSGANGDARTFKDVIVGEVWICSGQSNMEWTVNGALNPKEEKESANYPHIRHIKVPKVPSDSRENTFNSNWEVCSPTSVGNFTAVGYYFGRTLHEKLGVPIGLINSSWGGTRIEPWIPTEGFRIIEKQDFAKEVLNHIESVDPTTDKGKNIHLAAIKDLKQWVEKAETAIKAGKFPPKQPTSAYVGLGTSHQDPTRLYRGMIHPLVPYGIRGAIWYQGESNGNEGESYYHKKHGLVKGWRKVWGQGDFPFYWVQLANFTNDKNEPEGGDGYARIRDAERKALDIPHSGMAVIIDIGETGNIHPKNKQDVGKRLAQWGLANAYDKEIVPSGPLYNKLEIDGDKARIHFKHVGTGLIIGKKEGLQPTEELVIDAKLQRFAIAGKDKNWVWADAVIDGDTVILSHRDISKPVAVRYAYSANPLGANLYNREGFPASPFRTDDW